MQGKSRMPEMDIANAPYVNVFVDGGLTWLPPSDSFPANPKPGWAFVHHKLEAVVLYDGKQWLQVSSALSESDAFLVMNGLAMVVNGEVIEVGNGGNKR